MKCVASAEKWSNYTAFGSPMPGRKFTGSANKYRYTFNGKETDDETGTQDYGMRIYNPAIGKFLSVDPLQKDYPELTPYQFASNSPIVGIDIDGLEIGHYSLTYTDGKPIFKLQGVQTRFSSQGQKMAEDFSFGNVHYDWQDYEGGLITEWGGLEVHTNSGTYNFKTVEDMASWAKTQGPDNTMSNEAKVEAMQTILAANMLWADMQDGDIDNMFIGKIQGKQQASANNGVKPDGVKKGDYSDINPKKGTTQGGNFTQAQKKAILERNKKENGGVIKSDLSGKVLNQPKKDVKGVKTDMNSAQVDHIDSKVSGGSNAGKNAQVLSKEENTKKGKK